jgi:small-conductance mechanosensitive channel
MDPSELLAGLPPAARVAAVLAGAVLAGLLVYAAVFRGAARVGRRAPGLYVFDGALFRRTRRPSRMLFPLVAVHWVLPLLAGLLGRRTLAVADDLLHVLLVVAVARILIALTGVLDDVTARRLEAAGTDDLRARGVRTQVGLLRRVLVITICAAAVVAVLGRFDRFDGLGAGLVASAGVLGIVVSIAAQRPLGNLVAGIQLALSQPIRVGDSVVVENEWGTVEEITLTYVVVRIWDARRLVLPISHFFERPFQNWTRDRRRSSARCSSTSTTPPGRRDPPRVRAPGAREPPVGRAGVRPAGDRRHRARPAAARDHERAQRPRSLGPALRGARTGGGVHPSRAPRGAAAGAGGGAPPAGARHRRRRRLTRGAPPPGEPAPHGGPVVADARGAPAAPPSRRPPAAERRRAPRLRREPRPHGARDLAGAPPRPLAGHAAQVRVEHRRHLVAEDRVQLGRGIARLLQLGGDQPVVRRVEPGVAEQLGQRGPGALAPPGVAGPGRRRRRRAGDAAGVHRAAAPPTYSANSRSSAAPGSSHSPLCTGEHWSTSDRGAVIQWNRSDGGASATACPTRAAASSPRHTAASAAR